MQANMFQEPNLQTRKQKQKADILESSTGEEKAKAKTNARRNEPTKQFRRNSRKNRFDSEIQI
jgi:hypothetical protein